MAIAGKVAITLSTENGGAWSADVTYDRLVAVKHNNNLYISRKTVANVEPPNDEFWFLALEGFGGDDVQALIDRLNELSDLIQEIIDGTTQVGNAKTLDGHGAEYFATAVDLSNYLPKSGGRLENDSYTLYLKRTSTSGAPHLVFENGNGTLASISPNINTYELVTRRQNTGTAYTILDTGNKPTGTYTGNGSTVARNISIGGVGEVLIVAVDKGGGNFGVSVITKKCALVCDESGARTVPGAVFGVYAGTLSIATDNANLNALGVTYDYWLL